MESYGILTHGMLDALMRGMLPAAGSVVMQVGGVDGVGLLPLDFLSAFHPMDEEDFHTMDGMNPFCDCDACRERDAVRFGCRAHIRVLQNL